MVRDYPLYNWFDPMTAFPYGKAIDWGPLYPFIAATVCLITGANSRTAIISTASMVTPLMAVIMVPVMYKLGTILWNWKAGIVASGLISILSFQYFLYSSYGYVDHHIAEVLFTSLFFLTYICVLTYVNRHPVDLKSPASLYQPVLLSAVAGGIFFLALILSTTVLISLIIIAVFTMIQSILDYLSEKRPDYLLVLNLVMLTVSSILIIVFGFKREGLSLTQYTIGIVYLEIAIIAETALLFVFSKVFWGKKSGYLYGLIGLIIGAIALTQINLSFLQIRNQAMDFLFGISEYSVAVQETIPWTLSGAIANFNVSLVLMTGGFLILGYAFLKKRESELCFLLVWSSVMIFLTIQHMRFQLYLTIPVVILAAICITEPICWNEREIMDLATRIFSSRSNHESADDTTRDTPRINPPYSKKRKSPGSSRDRNSPLEILKKLSVIAVVILTIILIVISLSQDYQYGMNIREREIIPDWTGSLAWMENNTPKTGVPYFAEYRQETFQYPAESYGVMSWWDYGHWVTFFAKRIPITNAFQDNLYGDDSAAAFFLSDSESNADRILLALNGKYIITDSKTATTDFPGIVTWQKGSADISDYFKIVDISDAQYSPQLERMYLYDNPYFQTMIVRLHIFDGSMAVPDTMQTEGVRIMPASKDNSGNVDSPASTSVDEKANGASQSTLMIIRPDGDAGPALSKETYGFSDLPYKPIKKVPALTHYRLIYESPNDSAVRLFPGAGIMTIHNLKNVKIFEFVRGARIPGEGVIEISLMTNTGRSIVYHQESGNGEFIVPYATQDSTGEIRATGLYHIVGTSDYFSVTENDVINGNLVARISS